MIQEELEKIVDNTKNIKQEIPGITRILSMMPKEKPFLLMLVQYVITL